MSDTKFYFAEFGISGTLPVSGQYNLDRSHEERKRDVLNQYLNHDGPVVSTEGGNWYFGRVDPHDGLTYGKFGKTYSDEPTRYDEEEGDFVELGEETTDADYSMFILDFERRIIIFSSTYRVRNSNFITNMQDGYKNIIGDASELRLRLLENDAELQQILEEYPIYEIDAELRPTNPGPDPAFEELDESMQEMMVETLGITAKQFNGDGINVHEDFIQQVTSMSVSEYGESWRVKYDDNEVLKVVTSDSEPATAQIEEELDGLGALRDHSQELLQNAIAYLD